jgi:hypothetical protein
MASVLYDAVKKVHHMAASPNCRLPPAQFTASVSKNLFIPEACLRTALACAILRGCKTGMGWWRHSDDTNSRSADLCNAGKIP